ncbi:hypothetical protein QCA50_018105 [Cerrena zonata]|uniref:Uncharacterized protein n=1 Tax=Cerrena zonata TaxID=2478898 RepID=A0AAW0FIU1_9APHY
MRARNLVTDTIEEGLYKPVVVNAKAVTGLHISQIQLISTKTHKGFLIRSSCFDSGGREPLFHFSQATMFSALLILSWLLMYHPLMGLSSVAALNATSLPIILDDTVPLVSAHDKCASLAVLELPNVPYLKDFNPIVAVLILNPPLKLHLKILVSTSSPLSRVNRYQLRLNSNVLNPQYIHSLALQVQTRMLEPIDVSVSIPSSSQRQNTTSTPAPSTQPPVPGSSRRTKTLSIPIAPEALQNYQTARQKADEAKTLKQERLELQEESKRTCEVVLFYEV